MKIWINSLVLYLLRQVHKVYENILVEYLSPYKKQKDTSSVWKH